MILATQSCCTTRTKITAGFTLTEIAIALGIIGIILGAIWTAASRVYANQRVNKAVAEVLAVANAIRSSYGNRSVVAATASDLTATGITFGWFPADMIQNVLCQDGSTPCPRTPWNTDLLVYGNKPVAGGPAASNYFELVIQGPTMNGVPASDCPAFLAAVVGQSKSVGLNFYYSDYGNPSLIILNPTVDMPLNHSSITTCSGNVALSFTL